MTVSKRMLNFTYFLGVWIVILISAVTIRIFFFPNPPEVPGGTASCYGILLGLLTVVGGIIQWARSKQQS